MVDFPEGYGFAPKHKAKVLQESFLVDIGVFTRRQAGYVRTGRNRSPYTFDPIGYIRKESNELPLRGILFYDAVKGGAPVGPPVEGTLQQVVTALCTIHRMRGCTK
jgi:hypothetical protein